MTPTQEIVSVLFEQNTLDKAIAQFEKGNIKTPIDSQDTTFRLYSTKYGTINLEMLCRDKNGMFYQPIGFYEYNDGQIDIRKLTITVLNEFKQDFQSGIEINKTNIEVKFMSILESGIISAFSRETLEKVKEMFQLKEKGLPQSVIDRIGSAPHLINMQFDKSLMSNGLNIDLFFAFDGLPQCHLDDVYGIKGGFAVYNKNENGYSLGPATEHQANFEKFEQMELFTAFKGF